MSHPFHPLKRYSFNRPMLHVYGKVSVPPYDVDGEYLVIENHTCNRSRGGKLGPWEMKICNPHDETINLESWNKIELDRIYKFTITHKIEMDLENLELEGWFIDAEEIKE